MAAHTIAANGTLHMLYPSYVSSQNILPTFYHAKSSSFGAAWNYNLAIALNPGIADTNYKNAYQLVSHPSDATKLCFFTTGYSNGDADIFSIHSEDGGASWSAMQRVNDDAIANGKGQDMVWAAYNENGTLLVCWRDRRNATANGFWNADYQFYYATSVDNGAHFSSNKIIHAGMIPFDSLIVENGNDVMGCCFHSDTAYTVWGDTRNGKMNIYFNKFIASSNTSIGFSELGSTVDWELFPNPASNYVRVKNVKSGIGEHWYLCNTLGQCLQQGIITQDAFDIDLTAVKVSTQLYLIVGDDIRMFIKE
jgi:hypothetical protein